ncbi:SRPBCC family protein [Mycolicibacterium sp. F2034L]|uniref:SRPBCC family protein n=1 Tax=Mycolicibacterium sp. F2034L TaxID=2926422 RepID=UPI001FF4915A|nr:SRPBCC family protein [Mycolicibacterium sp. F2034L]MCK0173316.1 SRPBCC family protein [Mycolicibacterium sp. F2034L]
MTVTRNIAATRQRVWDVIADGWTYSQWVVGNSRMRAVDPDWPAPGATIHHSIGVWPVLLNDETVVEESVEPERLVLFAKGRPFGSARIILTLQEDGDRCCVQMEEYPVSGVGKLMPSQLADAAVWPRNNETLRRLAFLAERRDDKDVD